jgi:hypothetical protein
MNDQDSQRVRCTKCGAMVLPITAKTYNGLCAQCHFRARAEQAKTKAAVPKSVTPQTPLKIRVDEREFDELQLHLIREIIGTIKSQLEESGIPKKKIAEITGDLAFSIAAIIDGSRVMQANSRPVIPVLAFAENSERVSLVARPGGSSMHEYVMGIVDDVFDED